MSDRADELAAALATVRERIAAACSAAGRDPSEVRLLTITKTFPAADVALLADLGLSGFGEARDQEAVPKVEELAGLRPGSAPRWEMVGRLQRNKAPSVARWAYAVQSVDSPRLADALDRASLAAGGAGERSGPLRVLVQASIDGDTSRGGCPLSGLDELADRVASADGLQLAGAMAVAPLGADPDEAFATLAARAERVRRAHPTATELSAGMSGDLEAAIRHGSTCVRVGTALLGGRRLISP